MRSLNGSRRRERGGYRRGPYTLTAFFALIRPRCDTTARDHGWGHGGVRHQGRSGTMRRMAVAAVVCAVVVVGMTAGGAWALDCDGRQIDLGANPWQVKELCGEPAD